MVRVLVAATASALAAGCADDACLRGACPTPCAELAFACDGEPTATVGRLGDRPDGVGLVHAQGGDDDIVLDNGVVTAVIAALDAPQDLATSGGFVVDFGPTGGTDDLTILYQLAGILPEDTLTYRELTIDDRSPTSVAVDVRGTLDGRPDIAVATRYELRGCDPGLRIRTELFNGSDDVWAFTIADAAHWGKRRVVPFAPADGQGYVYPDLELLELTSLWSPFDYVAGATPALGAPAYGVVACDREHVEGVNDLEITALGTGLEVVHPGESLIYERFVVAAGAGAAAASGPNAAIEPLLRVRSSLFGAPPPRALAVQLSTTGIAQWDARSASLIVYERRGTQRIAVTAGVPDPDGAMTMYVPARAVLAWELWSFGRIVDSGDVPPDGEIEIAVEPPGQVAIEVAIDGVPADALVAFHPADSATRAAVTGTFHGQLGECVPWLGPPHGTSPACNRVLVRAGAAVVRVPPGNYDVFATAGIEATLGRAAVTVVAGEVTTAILDLSSLETPVAKDGWVSADLHVHGRASFDSGIPDRDRVLSFLAAGVDVIAATDHDAIADYADAVAALDAASRVHVMGGLETTPLLPFMDIPGEDVPLVIGHFNFWPLAVVPGAPRGGAPWDERLEPGELFDIMAPLVGPDGVMMMNHPWDEPQFGRDLGYLRAVGFDPRVPIPDAPTDGGNGHLVRRPGGGHRNLDWDLIEIINGAGTDEQQKARPLWFSLLAQGYVVPGTGNSDSHGLSDSQLGWARNWVDVGGAWPLDDKTIDDALRAGKVVAGTGVFVDVEIWSDGEILQPGIAPHVARDGDGVRIQVRAPPWVIVDEVRVVTSRGERILADGTDIIYPVDPFGTTGVVRWTGTVPLAELVDRDDFIVIEAGVKFPPVADLDDDGVADTGDNDGDGDADRDDVEDGEDTGPIVNPPDPDDPLDERWPVTRVIPGAWPSGFANPLIIDVDGGGWTPPGLP
jgi:hypothetical protein